MVTPVFRIFDYSKAIGFYVGWLGFHLDWEDRPATGPDYLQVSRGDVVLHLSGHPGDSPPGAKARDEILVLTQIPGRCSGPTALGGLTGCWAAEIGGSSTGQTA